MIKLYKIETKAINYLGRESYFTYTGTAGNSEIATRAVRRLAKKDGLIKVEILTIELLGEKEFGR